MKKKIEHIRKLLKFLYEDRFEMYDNLRHVPQVRIELEKRTKLAEGGLLDPDEVIISFSPFSEPPIIRVGTAMTSHHNGSSYSGQIYDVPLFEEFADFAISVLRNRAHNKISEGLERDEYERK